MNKDNLFGSLWWTFVLVAGIPVIFVLMGDFPKRTLLKDFLSLLTLLSLCLSVGQFVWCRNTNNIFNGRQNNALAKFHNGVGYAVVTILLLHPFFLILPRFFERGMTPIKAFTTIITTSSSIGIVLGIISWAVLVILGLTSFARKKLPFRFTRWRIFHGILSSLFLLTGTWHAIDLGRHTSFSVALLLIAYCTWALLLYTKNYFTKTISDYV